MSDMISDSESRKASRCRKNSPSDETSSGGNSCGGGPLKKGPWTSAEDAILVEYVTEHGEGNWNAVQKHSGLARCGKSCRLRWTNHLRPNLKKGAFTPEEEARIIELHAKMGNKWARMAAELPGRTDNEIKNFWNTRIKRLHRLGQPIYPPEIRMRANESQQSEDPGNGRKGERHHSGVPQANVLAIPNVEFKSLEFSQGLLTCPPHLLDIPTSNLLHRGASSSHTFGFALPTMNPQKHFCDMENQFQAPFTSTSDALSLFDPREDDAFLSPPHSDSLWLPSSFDPDPNVNHPLIIDFPGSHAPINGNSSSSKPVSVAVKPEELPSLQYPASQGGTWAPYGSRIPALVSVDSSIQSPFNEQAQSNCASPRNSGLLEAIVYESHSLSSSKNNSYPYMSEASAMAGDVVDSLSQNVHETKWEAYGDLGSPLSQTAASVFVDYPPIGGTSGDEPHFAEPVPGCKIKQEKAESESPETDGERDGSTELDFIRPDTLLDSLWFSHRPVCYKKLCITADIEPFLGDDTSFQYPQAGSLALDSNQSFSPESSAWVDTCLITKSH